MSRGSLGQSAPDAFAGIRATITVIRPAGATSGTAIGSSGESAEIFTGILDPYRVLELQRQ